MTQKENVYEKIYQDPFGVARMLDHQNTPKEDCEMFLVQT